MANILTDILTKKHLQNFLLQGNLTVYSMHKKNKKKANKAAEIDASSHASEMQSRWRMQNVAPTIYTEAITPIMASRWR